MDDLPVYEELDEKLEHDSKWCPLYDDAVQADEWGHCSHCGADLIDKPREGK